MFKLLTFLLLLVSTILGSPTVTIVTPKSGEVITQGDNVTTVAIAATYSGFTPSGAYQYVIYQNGNALISGALTGVQINLVTQSFVGTVNIGLNLTGSLTITAYIRGPDNITYYTGSSTFTIVPQTPPTPPVTVIPQLPCYNPCW